MLKVSRNFDNLTRGILINWQSKYYDIAKKTEITIQVSVGQHFTYLPTVYLPTSAEGR